MLDTMLLVLDELVAKAPVNLAGMAAQNVLDGDVSLAQWSEIPSIDLQQMVLLDVRRADERAKVHIAGFVHIPLDEVRPRMDEFPRDRGIVVHCRSGQRMSEFN